MGLFENFPYSNFHELNLDWILHKLKELDTEITNFVAINSVKYANPITWDITSQYETNTVVLDSSGNAYLSVQPVPAGVSLDNTEYWTNIGNFSALWENVKSSIAVPDEGHNTTASVQRAPNTLVWVDGQLYEVIKAMNAGDKYTTGDGGNSRLYTMQMLLDAMQAEVNTRQDADTAISERITTEITERKAADSAIKYAYFASVIDYGADNTGVTDSSDAVKAALAENENIIFPPGKYIVNNVTLKSNVHINIHGATISTNSKSFTGENLENIIFSGWGTIEGTETATRFTQVNNSENIKVDGTFFVKNLPAKPAFEFDNSNNIFVQGLFTTDSTLVLAVDCSYLTVRKCNAKYTANPNYCISITRVTENSYHDIMVDHCNIDGGNVLSLAAINISIDIPGGGTYNPVNNNFTRNYNIIVTNNVVVNCIGQCDGIDILYASEVTISNNIIKNCLEGIAILSTDVVVTNCVVTNCRGVGIAFGDPSLGSGGVVYSVICVSNCIIVNNGKGVDTIYKQPKANIGFIQQNGGFVASVYMSNLLVFGADYGIYANDNAGGSNIVVNSSFIFGKIKAVNAADLSQFYFNGIPTYNRRGAITPPEISTTNVTNTTGVDIDAHIVNNGDTSITVYLNDVELFTVGPHSTTTYRIYANATTRVSSTTNVVWSWQVV